MWVAQYFVDSWWMLAVEDKNVPVAYQTQSNKTKINCDSLTPSHQHLQLPNLVETFHTFFNKTASVI